MYIYVDIETRPTTDPVVIKRLEEAVKAPGQYKKPESIKEWMRTEGAAAKAEAVARTALDGTYGSIATIAFALGDDNVTVLDTRINSEAETLKLFHSIIRDATTGEDTTAVAFNGEFDFRFLYQRSVIHGVKRSRAIPTLRAKYEKYDDPMLMWSGWKSFIKQQELERVLGLTRDDSITGAEVNLALLAGAWDQVIQHNREDVRLLREIHRRMMI
jgi:uncharacterized protein YprB with RNaseH-like and TPR domain